MASICNIGDSVESYVMKIMISVISAGNVLIKMMLFQHVRILFPRKGFGYARIVLLPSKSTFNGMLKKLMIRVKNTGEGPKLLGLPLGKLVLRRTSNGAQRIHIRQLMSTFLMLLIWHII